MNDVFIKMGQKQLTTPDCINNINLQPNFIAKFKEIQLNASGWRCLRLQSMDAKLSKLDTIGGTSFVELPVSRESIIIVKNTKDTY